MKSKIEEKLAPPPIDKKYVQINSALAPRLQWEHNGGYCGEVSFISAGLYYGQYLSQYGVRAIASPGMPQNSQTWPGVNAPVNPGYYNAQLFLGVNDDSAAQNLRLNCERMDCTDSQQFLIWIKNHIAKGHPVIMGVFNNENWLYNQPSGSDAGDAEYDHIVPVIGFGSSQPLENGVFYPDDEILFSDNGLYTPTGNEPVYYFKYELNSFLMSRQQANNANGQAYGLLDLPKYQSKDKAATKKNYAIAILGVMDKQNETLPVHVVTDKNFESPSISSNSCARPAAEQLTLTITVSGLSPGETYNLYYYTDEKEVPAENFNHGKIKPWHVIKINQQEKPNSIYTTSLKIMSDQKAFFRAVRASAK